MEEDIPTITKLRSPQHSTTQIYTTREHDVIEWRDRDMTQPMILVQCNDEHKWWKNDVWEYLVMRTITSLERMTKNVEMKWVVTKGNESLSIIPLSFLSDMQRPMWAADRGSEFRMIRMGLDCIWNINVSTIGSWIKGLGLWMKPSSNFYCFPINTYHICLTLATTPVPPFLVTALGETLLRPSTKGYPARSPVPSSPTRHICRPCYELDPEGIQWVTKTCNK